MPAATVITTTLPLRLKRPDNREDVGTVKGTIVIRGGPVALELVLKLAPLTEVGALSVGRLYKVAFVLQKLDPNIYSKFVPKHLFKQLKKVNF